MAVIKLPVIPETNDPQALRSYLTQLHEQLTYALGNQDEDNMSEAYRTQNAALRRSVQSVIKTIGSIGYYASLKELEAVADRTDGKNTIFYSSTEPTNKSEGDVWYDTSASPVLIKRWTGIIWADITTDALSKAMQVAADAKAIADGKIRTFFSDSDDPPAGEIGEGDIWIVADLGNTIKRWNGSDWIIVQDIQNYVYTNADGVNVRSSDGKYRAVFSSTALAFYEQDAWVGEFSGGQLYTNIVNVTNRIVIGPDGDQFTLSHGTNTLTLDYIG